MNKFLSIGSLLIGTFVAISAIATIGSTPAQAAAQCSAEAIGARASAFAINGDTATVKFKVTGEKDCRVQLSTNSFYAPTMDGRPYNKQILFERVTKTFGPGTYTMSAKLPAKSNEAKGCFYQVDLTYGTFNRTPVLAYGHGKLNCNVPPVTKTIKVCELATKKIITIDEKAFNAKLHSKTLSDCKTPEQIEVCVLASKERALIKQSEFNAQLHSKDMSKCEEAPVATTETPAQLPQTGPAQTAMQLFGLGSMIASAGYYIQSRR